MRKLDIAEQSHIWGGDASIMPIKFHNGDDTAIAENRAPNSHEQSIISSFSPTSPFSTRISHTWGNFRLFCRIQSSHR
ncbi:hypothetical protein, partial [Acetobacter cerevisiae]|uniref:hypothetical protein n=1 Tax=Acetobacter cerevisiae TaxID=178900 RepID=UPI0022308F63